jgi:hypothetical protein
MVELDRLSSLRLLGIPGDQAMYFKCPKCAELLLLEADRDGLNYCVKCHNLFFLPRSVPSWVHGILVVLAVNWQMCCR